MTEPPPDIQQIISLPPLPISVVRLSELVGNTQAALSEYIKIIELDPVLTSSVLRWANSSWSHAQGEIDTVQNAVVRLGTENIIKLAVGHHMMASIRKTAKGFDPAEDLLWKHSMATAIAMEVLKMELPYTLPASSFAVAVIHDIGKLIIARNQYDGNYYAAIKARMKGGSITELEAENEVLGWNHVDAGIQVMEQWGLPNPMIEAVSLHHEPGEDSNPLADALYLANRLVNHLELNTLGFEHDHHDIMISEPMKRTWFDTAKVNMVLNKIKEQIELRAQEWS